jgi:tRNA A-37 threonylcarbamoyl transferase component Bud32
MVDGSHRYVVYCRRPHWWLIGLGLLASYVLWTGDGVPLVQKQNDAYMLPSMEPRSAPRSTGKVHSNILLWLARCGDDVVAHGFPAGLMWNHKRFINVAMSCDTCHCQGACHCGPGVKEVDDPFTSGDFTLAYMLLLLPLGGLMLLLSQTQNLALTATGLIFTPSLFAASGRSMLGLGSGCLGLPGTPIGPRRWPEVDSIQLTADSQGANLRDSTVNFKFADGTQANIKLRSLRDVDLNSLYLGLEKWADQEKISPEVINLLRSALEKEEAPPEIDSTSYTAMWENDLSSHMGATTFVPLTKGATLQSGRFKIFALLSSGGLSAVYLAEHADGQLVILKESVVPQHIDDKLKEKARELFDREAKLLLKLNHPQIARVIDHIVEGGRDYLVLEYLSGQNLRQLVKRAGPQSEEIVLKWTVEIASVLEYLHGLEPPVVHRDLTPDNIVLKEDGSIAVIDFGAANEYVGAATGTLIGKQSYIAPEQFRGKSSPLSDIYALGCTLNFLLTGEDPEALSVSHPRSLRAEISEPVDAFVASLTAMNEQERISSAQQVKERVSSILSQQEGRNDKDAPVSPSS